MDSHVQTETGTGTAEVLAAAEAAVHAVVVAALPEADAAGTAREARLAQVGAMVARIVHDLMQDVGIIQGVAELAREGELTPEMADMQLNATARMKRKIRDLLAFSRGVGQVAFRDVPIQALVDELDEIVLRKLERRGILVQRRIRGEGPVRCDRALLVRALVNIIANAGEAMPQAGELVLTVEDCGDSVVFIVQDTGCGIPDEVLSTVFDPFVSHDKQGGTGLGLAITREVVAAHGGVVQARSTVGRGSTFVVTLPRQPA